MEEKKSIKLKNKVDWKRVVKLSLISVALLLLVVLNVVSAVGGRDERADSGVVAYAEVSGQTYGESRYYFELPVDMFLARSDGGTTTFVNNNAGVVSLNFYLDFGVNEYRYSYATWYTTNNTHIDIINGQPLLRLTNLEYTMGSIGRNYLTAPFRVYLSADIIERLYTYGNSLDNTDLYLSRLAVSINGVNYNYDTNINNIRLDVYQELGYNAGYGAGESAGYDSGYDSGYTAGESAGYDSGYDSGYNAGESAGYEEGYNNGLQKGMSEVVVNPFVALLNPIDDFINMPLFGDFTLGSFISVVLFVSLAIIFLKMFAGG